jgi:hypothetical protein
LFSFFNQLFNDDAVHASLLPLSVVARAIVWAQRYSSSIRQTEKFQYYVSHTSPLWCIVASAPNVPALFVQEKRETSSADETERINGVAVSCRRAPSSAIALFIVKKSCNRN